MRKSLMTAMALALVCASASASMEVLVEGAPVREYHHNGTVYIEALRGRDFSIRLSNPTPYRVAVALSVDGLNTIDARHTSAWSARKWVLDPWESTVISGWQVDMGTARRFFFTGERNSYGAALGQTQNLGVIEAVFYRERPRRRDAKVAPPSPPASGSAAAPREMESNKGMADEYAATGMGERDRHEVEAVDIDLDSTPIASARVRYEFRPQLVRLGVLLEPSPLERREGARGFCPEPR
ncbi:MAG TPA: hypothetical protein VI670_02730 [Thermoanaerobaculia bacterium]|jgi:hypothetical protein